MKICMKQYLGENHSWAVCGRELARVFLKHGHQVDLCSTDGTKHLPDDLKPFLKEKLDTDYDMQLSYTAMLNFPHYLSNGNKNRFGIWNYEFTEIPKHFVKYVDCIDKFLPSSNFSKEIFKKNKIPEEKMTVIPHGVDFNRFKNAQPFELKTKKKIKFLANIAQPHIRKNIPGLLEAWGRAFTKKDDVCLVLKIAAPSADVKAKAMQVSFPQLYSEFQGRFKNHAECEIIDYFIPEIERLYKACNVVYTMTHAECFYFPALEGLAAGNLIISPRYGGQLDYLHDGNSLLIGGKMIPAPIKAQYWTPSVYSGMFSPDIDEAAGLLQKCASNYLELKEKLLSNVETEILPKYTWDAVYAEIMNLCAFNS